MEYTGNSEINQFEALIQGLIDNGFGCCNDFILPSTIVGLQDNIHNLNIANKLKSSGIGNRDSFNENKAVRGDKINWIEKFENTNVFEQLYLKKIERFIAYLNKTCYTSIKSFESHYSSYQKESFYKRHIDQFKSEKGRQFSLVLYLNDHWKQNDGGLLSLYPQDEEPINILPLGGRLVLFRSDEMEHEVHASHTRERRSIAGWLKN